MKTFIVDSFTDKAFKGNPAGVCILESSISDELMLKITQELGFSETAFVTPIKNSESLTIRFFTPIREIPLCGHATLASAKVIFEITKVKHVEFINIQEIKLPVQSINNQIAMRFPLYETIPSNVPEALLIALGVTKVRHCAYNQENKMLLLEIETTDELLNLNPDYEALYNSHDSINGVVVTAQSEGEYDFHSRYFWPWNGTNEDPVTGATHTFLSKYWAEKLGKKKMKSFQNSSRTGFMEVEIDDKEVLITGNAVIVFRGEFLVSTQA